MQQLIASSASAMASLNEISDEQIPFSKSTSNAIGVALEDQLMQALPLAQDGMALRDLLSNPQRFGQLTQIYFDQALRTPGGFQHLSEMYLAVGDRIGAFGQEQQQPQGVPQGAAQNFHQMQQMQQQQMPQQATYQWSDGQNANSRESNFPGIPANASGGSSANLGQVPPDQQWQMVDHLERSGGFRGKILVQP